MSISHSRRAAKALPFALFALFASTSASAHGNEDAPALTSDTSREPPTTLDTVVVSAAREQAPVFPATQAGISAGEAKAAINAVDVEDVAKYLPGVFLRKRNYGDTQAVLATRTWGLNSSARTLVYIDDIPVSALIANNNTIGAPRWGMVSPQAIDHLDMLYGPFSAAYSGNAMGGVMRIATRRPEKAEVTIRQTEALQSFDLHGRHDQFATHQASVNAGGRNGRLSWVLGANLQDSASQPLSYITSATPPAGTSGAIVADNKLGQPADVIGAGGLLHTRMRNLNAMFEYDLTPTLRATYLVDDWRNDGWSRLDTFLVDANGQPTYGSVAGFANNIYSVDAHHRMQALSLKSDTRREFDGSVVATRYDFLRDRQLSPAGVADGTGLTPDGRLADYAGTGWSTLDVKGIWRPTGFDGAHEIAAGLHADTYELDNPTRNTDAWTVPDSAGALFSSGRGRTRTRALWIQDAWRFAPGWLATIGGRYERWRASDGFNFNAGVGVVQPTQSAAAFSPKLAVQWNPAPGWRIGGSLAKAVRFATVGELYQLVSTGSTVVVPDANLKPETARSGELSFEHARGNGLLRLSLFQDNTRDALIAQTAFLAAVATPVSYTMNVGELRNRGLELVARRNDAWIDGLELSGSVTFVDSTILSNPDFASTAGTTSTGKQAPYVPRWRATAVATWRPNDDWAFTFAGRYSSRQYSTLDNIDNTAQVFGAFDRFLVFDARVRYRINDHFAAAMGIDNLGNEKYFLYHPFPQRTYVFDLEYEL